MPKIRHLRRSVLLFILHFWFHLVIFIILDLVCISALSALFDLSFPLSLLPLFFFIWFEGCLFLFSPLIFLPSFIDWFILPTSSAFHSFYLIWLLIRAIRWFVCGIVLAQRVGGWRKLRQSIVRRSRKIKEQRTHSWQRARTKQLEGKSCSYFCAHSFEPWVLIFFANFSS